MEKIHDFCRIVRELGEKITFHYENGDNTIEEIKTYASLVPSTEAAYNLTDREFLFKGEMLTPSKPRKISGMYFTRDFTPSEKYMILTDLKLPYCDNLSTVFAVQTNEKVSICQAVEYQDENLNFKDAFVVKDKDIDAYFTTVVRSLKYTNDGTLDQAIYNCFLPAKYQVAPDMRILKKSFDIVKNDKGVSESVYQDVAYRVQSIDTSLVNYDSLTDSFTGIISMQLSVDLRSEIKLIDSM